MIFTLGELREMEPVLSKIMKADVVNIRFVYKFSKFLKIVSTELKNLEEMRQRLVKKYGTQLHDGSIKVSSDKEGLFLEEINTVLMEKIDIPFEPISLNDLEHTPLNPGDLILIEKLIQEEETK